MQPELERHDGFTPRCKGAGEDFISGFANRPGLESLGVGCLERPPRLGPRSSHAMVRPEMKLPVLAALALLLVAVGCTSVVSVAARSSCDWAFVQSVGGIAVGTPRRDDRGHVWLPIRCDVSGLETITTRPTTTNSGNVCVPPRVRVRSSTVYLTVRTSLPSKRYPTSRCPDADLGELPAGRYAVVYDSPDGSEHPLGSIQLP